MNRDLIWGRSQFSRRVHLFIDGKRQCISSTGDPQPAIDIFPNWDSEDKLTCHKCHERYFWLMKGAIPQTQRTEPTAQTL